MEFILLTSESTFLISNAIKVKGHLKSGLVEIFDKHQYLMGLIENNLVEIESAIDSTSMQKREHFFVLQDGIFIVSNAKLENENKKTPTTVYVYAKAFYEIDPLNSCEQLVIDYEKKKHELTFELEKNEEKNNSSLLNLVLTSKILLLKEEIEFLRNAVIISNTLRASIKNG